MKWHIALGTFAMVAIAIAIVFIAANETGRMESFTQSYHCRRIEAGATLFENNCRTCHGPQGEGIPGVAPAINAADLYNGERLAAVGYSGTLEEYLRGVLIAGRPVPSAGTNYPQRMPAWGQESGGPLRSDQIEALVAFILNWEERALLAGDSGESGPLVGEAVGTDITRALPDGDVAAGLELAESAQAGCSACHLISNVGPAWEAAGGEPGIGRRAELRIQASDYSGEATTATQYLLESIVNSNAYVVEGYDPALMPKDYGQRLTAQQAADLIEYMLSLE